MDLSKKVSIDKAMTMSLDEYIKESGVYVSPMFNHYKSQKNKTIVEDVDPDITFLKTELLSDGGDDFDLRNKLTLKDIPAANSTPKVNSQQWRLLHPNNIQNRPAGMPPLVSKERSVEDIFSIIQKKNNSGNNKNRRRWRNRRRNRMNNMDKNNDGQQMDDPQDQRNHQYQQRQQQNNICNNKHSLNKVSSGRVERRNNKDPWAGWKGTNGICRPLPMDLRIEATSANKPAPNFQMPIQFLQQQPQQITNLGSNHPVAIPQNASLGTLPVLNPSSFLDACGGIRLECMPLIAGKLLEALQGTSRVAMPKYDMKIQKEIHEIQGKPMVYKCPGGEVLSSDGNGLNCRLTPASTGVSLNQRFA